MQDQGLLFIPDISGFSKFVTETEISHSRLIIQELLEILINANQIDLQVSEIEGDAILFYRFGDAPDIKELYDQVQAMFCSFHKNLISYENLRFCQCKACMSAVHLSLKVITHYGEFTGYSIKSFNKLIGKDIIVAHQLLKNKIEKHEYWLVTDDLLHNNKPGKFTKWMEWDSSTQQTESGKISFHYTQLGQLKKEITPDSTPDPELSRKAKVLSVTKNYDAGLVPLLHALGDFNYRSHWQEGVKKVEEAGHYLPRLGVKRRCLLENGETVVYASSYSYTPDRIEFSETDEKTKNTTYFTLIKTGKGKTMLTMDYYIKKNWFGSQLAFNWNRKKAMKASFERSLNNLAALVKQINVPDTDAYPNVS